MIDSYHRQNWQRRVKRYLLLALLGGIVYWCPYIICRWVFGGRMIWFISITLLVPLLVAYVYFLVRRKMKDLESPRTIAFLMLIGIWVSGPLGLVIGEIPYGVILDVRGFLSLWATFPLSTFMLTAYNYSLLSLMITTVMLMIFAVVNKEKKNREKDKGSPIKGNPVKSPQ